MERDAIRILNTTAEDLEAGNVEHLVRVFGGISGVPRSAKLLRGKVALGFPSYEEDPRPNYAIPPIRAFVQALDAVLPHFPYFLIRERPAGQILFYLLCLTDCHDSAAGVTYRSTDLLTAVNRKYEDVTRFCYRIADDPERAAQPLFTNLPAEILRVTPELTRLALASMRDLLSALRAQVGQPSASAPGEAPKWGAYQATLLNEAGELAGLDRARFGSDAQFLDALLELAS